MRRFLLIGLVAVFSTSLVSETESLARPREQNGVTNGLGAGGTVYDTWGFMYRRHFENNFGVSTSLGGWIDQDYGHIGNELGLLYTLAHHSFQWSALPNASIRVHLVAYLANIYRRFFKKNNWDIGLGAGPGLEFFFNKHFSLHLELPWMTFVRADGRGLSFRSSYPHIGGGLIYYF